MSTQVVGYVECGAVVRAVGRRPDGQYVMGFPTVGQEVHWSVCSWAVTSLREAFKRASSDARFRYLRSVVEDGGLHFNMEDLFTGEYLDFSAVREPVQMTINWENPLQ